MYTDILCSSYSNWAPGWVEFNTQKWGFSAEILSLKGADGTSPQLELQLFRNKRGELVVPPWSSYIPTCVFFCKKENYKREREWLEMGEKLCAALNQFPILQVTLPPEIRDVRPFLWADYTASPRYTYQIDFPFNLESVDRAVRKQVAKTEKEDFRFVCLSGETSLIENVVSCFGETETRQSFAYNLSSADITQAWRCLTADRFRIYVCLDKDNRVLSSRIVLHEIGTRAIDLVAGTRTTALKQGVTQGLISFVLSDLQSAGATGFDFSGANIKSVAASKSLWGGDLRSFYSLTKPNLRTNLRLIAKRIFQ